MYTKQDIKSHCTGKLYAEQNEQVEVISACLHVAIVQGKRGRFPVLVEMLSEQEVVVVVDVPEVEIKQQLELW